MKINSEWITDLKIKDEIKIFRKKERRKISVAELGKAFLIMMPNHDPLEKKKDKLNFIKILKTYPEKTLLKD